MSEERMIGGYRIVRLIATGGMSEVYEVENVRLGSRHALKLFVYEKGDEDVRERFLVEGRLLAKLSHPRIVRVTDFGVDETSGRPFFVMDLIRTAQGVVQSLGEVAPGTVDEEEIGRWYDDLREGLDYIHTNGVIHRDLKLQNVLIGPDGHVVLTDFGISKIFDPDGEGNTIVDTVNTIVKMKEGRSLVMGSVGYMAPELEMGVAASPQSDYYALGIIIYRLLTGSWCDARTDVTTMLETYDPVWKTILPKLLHSNPNGRECVSYAEARREEFERREFAAEERWLGEKSRGHFARHAARWLAAVLALALGTIVVMALRFQGERNVWEVERRLSPAYRAAYSFDEVFRIPPDAKADEQTDENGNLLMPSREDLTTSRLDLMVITHEIFSRLTAGSLQLEEAVVELERMREEFDEESNYAFDRWPNGYLQIGTDEATDWLLARAIDRLKELAEQ